MQSEIHRCYDTLHQGFAKQVHHIFQWSEDSQSAWMNWSMERLLSLSNGCNNGWHHVAPRTLQPKNSFFDVLSRKRAKGTHGFRSSTDPNLISRADEIKQILNDLPYSLLKRPSWLTLDDQLIGDCYQPTMQGEWWTGCLLFRLRVRHIWTGAGAMILAFLSKKPF